MSDPRHDGGQSREPGTFDLRLNDIGKRYGAVTVLSGISYTFKAGHVYGVLGENGAGKSTLMRILSGLEPPTEGTLQAEGNPVRLHSPADALRLGISIITQEQTLMPHRTVLDNVYLGRFPDHAGFMDSDAARRKYRKLAEITGSDIDPKSLVKDLGLAQRQQVEIMRAVDAGSNLIIMDEPTAILDEPERDRLTGLIRTLADHGIAVVLISHYLDEVLRVCDEILVLRNGRLVLSAIAANCTPAILVKAMSGSEPHSESGSHTKRAPGPAMLSIRSLGHGKDFADVSFDVRRGEIVGLTGLVGSGITQILAAISGDLRADTGSVTINNGKGFRPRSIRQTIGLGIGYVPQDRRREGLFLGRSISFNISSVHTASSQGPLSWWNDGNARRLAKTQIKRFGIRSESADQPVGQLSGGNQQKTLFAKTLAIQPTILLVDEPTRGVDVTAKAEIHATLDGLARTGVAVCIASTDIDEIRELSDRIIVVSDGAIQAEHSADKVTREELLREAFGMGDYKTGETHQ